MRRPPRLRATDIATEAGISGIPYCAVVRLPMRTGEAVTPAKARAHPYTDGGAWVWQVRAVRDPYLQLSAFVKIFSDS